MRIISTDPDAGSHRNLHIYLPPGNGPFPFLLGIHGGGWRSGDQSSYRWMWPKIESIGCALVLTSYRLAPDHPFPCAYDDLLHTLRWLRENGAAEHLDSDRCLLVGGSAGAHLAMLLATRATAESVPSPTLRGVAAFCGIFDLASQHRWDTTQGNEMTQRFLRSTPEENPLLYASASPLAHLHAKVPPAWISHGSADTVVSPDQSRLLVRKLRDAGHDPVYLEARGLTHTMIEPQQEGDSGEFPEILFERDFLRFVTRNLEPGRR